MSKCLHMGLMRVLLMNSKILSMIRAFLVTKLVCCAIPITNFDNVEMQIEIKHNKRKARKHKHYMN
ncbi:hypothetical protein ACJX0J_009076, partial [Zea mays]